MSITGIRLYVLLKESQMKCIQFNHHNAFFLMMLVENNHYPMKHYWRSRSTLRFNDLLQAFMLWFIILIDISYSEKKNIFNYNYIKNTKIPMYMQEEHFRERSHIIIFRDENLWSILSINFFSAYLYSIIIPLTLHLSLQRFDNSYLWYL